MPTKADEERAGRIRAVIHALTGKGTNSPGIQQEHLPAALVAFFTDELREQIAQVVELLKTPTE